MKVLIGVLSCERDRQYEQQLRNTWLKNCPVDYKFFLGGRQTQPIAEDEVVLDVSDSYRDLLHKTHKLIEYSDQRDYDYLFKCDVDSYCHVPRLLKSGFEQHDYINTYGGSGYWLSRRAIKTILEKHTWLDVPESEDVWVERNLRNAGIQNFNDLRYHSTTNEGPSEQNDLITSHWYMDGKRIIQAVNRFKLITVYHERASKISLDKIKEG